MTFQVLCNTTQNLLLFISFENFENIINELKPHLHFLQPPNNIYQCYTTSVYNISLTNVDFACSQYNP
jgi:hypothetical protein